MCTLVASESRTDSSQPPKSPLTSLEKIPVKIHVPCSSLGVGTPGGKVKSAAALVAGAFVPGAVQSTEQ
jgi:hypothetical protein